MKQLFLKKPHLVLAVLWGFVLVAAIGGLFWPVLGFLLTGAFISICSIYANMVGHWSGREGEKNVGIEEFRAFRDEVLNRLPAVDESL